MTATTTPTAGTTKLLPVYTGEYRIRDIASTLVPTADLAPGDATVATIDGSARLVVVVWVSRVVGEPGHRKARLVTFHPDGVDQDETTTTLPDTTWTVIRTGWGRNRWIGPTGVQYHARLSPGRTACGRPLAVPQSYVGGQVDWDRVLTPVDGTDTDRWCEHCLTSLALTAGHAHS